ncbi:hypothetical protein DFH05DRAFT_1537978 [Lentinula detonsa]|uniref:Uncharacterized protein n=1 Tax=Lentinula detonsa TaxID=2804962 RepID=A0A9W8NRL7_9AGAR|nr:hypothetical protein DFH05DRAFT_1537978 [Lentinula detonsa]
MPEKASRARYHGRKSTNVVEKEDDDCCEDGLRVPKSVLDGCLSSFTAADEARVKGSTQFFDVTAQMALLCRHDRPLWAVNMHTAGEGQHYTLALLASLFEHLPSCVKWGFLKPYMSRTTFAISIFHAFGHQWPCQIVYHPQKCIGYGLSDGRSKNLGKSAVEEVIRIRKSRDMLTEKVSHLREIIINPSTPTWDVATAELELQTAKESLSKVQAKLASKERALGERQRVQLRTLVKSTYINKRMNALALLTRIRERLRSRKFELDRLECSYRKQRSEQRVNDHTQDSVKRRDPTIASLARKYNQYCVELARLIEQRKATRNAVPPKAIDMDKLFSLDVDDDIWLDIGLGYDNNNDNNNDNTAPPLWLSNEKIREEMNIFFQVEIRKDRLRRLFVAWERAIVGIPATENLPEWGLSQGEMIRAREEQVFGGGIEQMEDAFDIEFEADADELLTEHLDSLRVTENYKESRRSIEL